MSIAKWQSAGVASITAARAAAHAGGARSRRWIWQDPLAQTRASTAVAMATCCCRGSRAPLGTVLLCAIVSWAVVAGASATGADSVEQGDDAGKETPRVMTVVEALRQGAGLFQEGDYAGALGLYDQVLRARPGNSDALHLRGLVMMQWGRFAEAEANITAAVDGVWPHGPGVESVVDGTRDGSGMPRSAANYLNSLGQVYRHARRWADAEVAYRLAMAGDPKAVAPAMNLATLLDDSERGHDAVPLYERVLRAQPGRSEVVKKLGARPRAPYDTPQTSPLAAKFTTLCLVSRGTRAWAPPQPCCIARRAATQTLCPS